MIKIVFFCNKLFRIRLKFFYFFNGYKKMLTLTLSKRSNISLNIISSSCVESKCHLLYDSVIIFFSFQRRCQNISIRVRLNFWKDIGRGGQKYFHQGLIYIQRAQKFTHNFFCLWGRADEMRGGRGAENFIMSQIQLKCALKMHLIFTKKVLVEH